MPINFTNANIRVNFDDISASNIDITGLLDVSGNTTMKDVSMNNLDVVTDLGVGGNANITGNLDIDGSANITGNLDIVTDLDVGGNADITGDLDVDGSANIAGNLTIGDTNNYTKINEKNQFVMHNKYIMPPQSGITNYDPQCNYINSITPLSTWPGSASQYIHQWQHLYFYTVEDNIKSARVDFTAFINLKIDLYSPSSGATFIYLRKNINPASDSDNYEYSYTTTDVTLDISGITAYDISKNSTDDTLENGKVYFDIDFGSITSKAYSMVNIQVFSSADSGDARTVKGLEVLGTDKTFTDGSFNELITVVNTSNKQSFSFDYTPYRQKELVLTDISGSVTLSSQKYSTDLTDVTQSKLRVHGGGIDVITAQYGNTTEILMGTTLDGFCGIQRPGDTADLVLLVGSVAGDQQPGKEAIRIKAISGNVGIGTDNAQSALHVAGPLNNSNQIAGVHMGTEANNNCGIVIRSNTTAGESYIDFNNTEQGGAYARILCDTNNKNLRFSTGGTETKMILTHEGKLGIGTTTPCCKLTVVGDTKLERDLVIDGSANIAGNLDIDGSANITGNLDVVNDLGVGGNANITGDLDIDGSANITGNLTLKSTSDGEELLHFEMGDRGWKFKQDGTVGNPALVLESKVSGKHFIITDGAENGGTDIIDFHSNNAIGNSVTIPSTSRLNVDGSANIAGNLTIGDTNNYTKINEKNQFVMHNKYIMPPQSGVSTTYNPQCNYINSFTSLSPWNPVTGSENYFHQWQHLYFYTIDDTSTASNTATQTAFINLKIDLYSPNSGATFIYLRKNMYQGQNADSGYYEYSYTTTDETLDISGITAYDISKNSTTDTTENSKVYFDIDFGSMANKYYSMVNIQVFSSASHTNQLTVKEFEVLGTDKTFTDASFNELIDVGVSSNNKQTFNFVYTPYRQKELVLTEKLGIGTDNPQSALHVAGPLNNSETGFGVHMGTEANNNNCGIVIRSNTTAGESYIDFNNTEQGGAYARILCDTNIKNLRFSTGGTETKMILTHEGKLGIGTTTPCCKLTVVGDTKLGANLDVTGNADITGDLTVDGTINLPTSISVDLDGIVGGNTPAVIFGTTITANNEIVLKEIESGSGSDVTLTARDINDTEFGDTTIRTTLHVAGGGIDITNNSYGEAVSVLMGSGGHDGYCGIKRPKSGVDLLLVSGSQHTSAQPGIAAVKITKGKGDLEAKNMKGNELKLTTNATNHIAMIDMTKDITCILMTNGAVKTFGTNVDGQLGINQPEYRPPPAAANTYWEEKFPKNVSLGNDKYINGDAVVDDNLDYIYHDISGQHGTAIACGLNHTAVLLKDGSVKTFGNNYYGQLGNGNNNSSNFPVPISGIDGTTEATTATAIACGWNYTVVLMQDGNVKTFGINDYGQLGRNDYNNSNVPVSVHGIYGATPATTPTAIACGGKHTAVLMQNGTVRTFGSNSSGPNSEGSDEAYGQLGDGSSENKSFTTVLVSGIDGTTEATTATAIACGWEHTAVLMQNKNVKTFGRNDYGQLGNQLNLHSPIPVNVKDTGGINDLTNAIAIACGKYHTLVLRTDGNVRVFGDNQHGQFGNGQRGTNISSNIPKTTAISYRTNDKITSIFAKENNSLFFIDNSFNRVLGCGENKRYSGGTNNKRAMGIYNPMDTQYDDYDITHATYVNIIDNKDIVSLTEDNGLQLYNPSGFMYNDNPISAIEFKGHKMRNKFVTNDNILFGKIKMTQANNNQNYGQLEFHMNSYTGGDPDIGYGDGWSYNKIMTMTGLGVGIGTNNPKSALHVAGIRNNSPNSAGVHMGMNDNHCAIEICCNGAEKHSYIDFNNDDSDDDDADARILCNTEKRNLQFSTGGYNAKMTLNEDGILVIGTNSTVFNDFPSYNTGDSNTAGQTNLNLGLVLEEKALWIKSGVNNKDNLYINGGIRLYDYNNRAAATYKYYVRIYYDKSDTTNNNNSIQHVTNNFTGQHRNYGINEIINNVGFIVRSTGNYRNQMGQCDECNKHKISINESLPIVEYSSKPNDKAAWGVISNKDDSTEETQYSLGGGLKIALQQAREDRPLIVNSLGEGAMWVTNVNGAIENGDYMTSSLIPGLAMRQNDDLLHNYTVAKITMDCNFDDEQRPAKQLRYETVQTTDASGVTTDISQGVIDPVTQQFVYDLVYDDSGNQVFVDKYDEKWIRVFADKYVIYNDEAETDEHFTYEFDFANASAEHAGIVGNQYQMAFVGCTYHCG